VQEDYRVSRLHLVPVLDECALQLQSALVQAAEVPPLVQPALHFEARRN